MTELYTCGTEKRNIKIQTLNIFVLYDLTMTFNYLKNESVLVDSDKQLLKLLKSDFNIDSFSYELINITKLYKEYSKSYINITDEDEVFYLYGVNFKQNKIHIIHVSNEVLELPVLLQDNYLYIQEIENEMDEFKIIGIDLKNNIGSICIV